MFRTSAALLTGQPSSYWQRIDILRKCNTTKYQKNSAYRLTAASRSQSKLRPEPQLPGRSTLVPGLLATQLTIQCRITLHGQLDLQTRYSTWHHTAVSTTAKRSHLTFNRNWRADQISYCLAVKFTALSKPQQLLARADWTTWTRATQTYTGVQKTHLETSNYTSAQKIQNRYANIQKYKSRRTA